MARLGNLKPGMVFHHDGSDGGTPCFGSVLEIVGSDVKVLLRNKEIAYWALGTEVSLGVPQRRVEEPPTFAQTESSPLPRVSEGNQSFRSKSVENRAEVAPFQTISTPKKRYALFGHPVTAILRWMGAQGWTLEQVQKVLGGQGITCSPSTVKLQIGDGVRIGRGEEGRYGKMPSLTKDQIKQLQAARK